MAFILAVILSFIPACIYSWIAYWMDRYEKEPFHIVVKVFLWGAIVATIGAIIASAFLQAGVFLITKSGEITDVAGIVLIAPFVEESLKGLAVLLVFKHYRHEFDSILDGIIYAGIVALGFAATENVLYLYFHGYADGGGYEGLFRVFFMRVILGGWNHAVYTAFIGIGLAVARLDETKKSAPTIGFIVAFMVHAIHNGTVVVLSLTLGVDGLIVLYLIDWVGWVVVFGVMLWAINREKRWIVQYLPEEVSRGIITKQQFEIARSSWAQTFARLRALFKGHLKPTRRFYQLCAELAQKKHQLAIVGEEQNNSVRIKQLRGELRVLSTDIQP